MKQKRIELKGEIDKPIIIVGDFKTLLSKTDETTRQNTSKYTEDLNNITNQRNLSDIYATLHPTTAQCTFFFKCL